MKARKRKPGVRPLTGTDPKKKAEGTSGKAAVIKRNKKGQLSATLPSNFGGVSQETLAQDRNARAESGDGTFGGGPAPRVGGVKVERRDGPIRGGTRSQVRRAKRRARRSSAHPAARRAAVRAY